MAQRIARHHAERPPQWLTIEEPIELERTIADTAEGEAPSMLMPATRGLSEQLALEGDAIRACAGFALRAVRRIAVRDEAGLHRLGGAFERALA